MPIADFLAASGVRVHAHEIGLLYASEGSLWVSKPAIRGIDSHLFACLKIACDECQLALNVNSIDTGEHAPNSRHYQGRAVDINKVVVSGQSFKATGAQATLENPRALKLLHYLLAQGFRIGEGGAWPGLFFGPPHTRYCPIAVDHSRHLHVSLPRHR